jgi:hypothetical protein
MKSNTFLAILLLIIPCCALVSRVVPKTPEDHSKNLGHPWEEFDTSYFAKFQSVNDIIEASDRHFKGQTKDTLTYFNYVAEIVRKRFYHGYSHYTASDNIFAWLSGTLVWNHLSAIVIPDDIMKHPMAACSQQAIVMMEIFKRKGIDYRKVGFPHHYTVEGKIDGKWQYFDTNLEPNFNNKRESLELLFKNNRIDSVYSVQEKSNHKFHEGILNPKYGRVNSDPAPRASLFHKICFVLQTKIFICCSLIFAFLLLSNFHPKRLFQFYKLRVAYNNNGG